MIPIFWILSYVIIYNIFRGKRLILNFFLLGIISSLIIDMEIVVGLLYSAGIAVAVLITQRKVLSIKNISVGFLGFLLVLIPRVIFDIRHENLLSKSFIQGISSMVLDGGSGGSVTPLAQKILLIFGSWSDTITLGNRSFGLVALILTTLASVAFYRYGNDKLKFFLKITLIAIVISILGILSFGHDIWGHYLMIFPLLFVTWVSIAFGLGFCIKKYKIILLIVAMGLIIFNMNIPDRIKEYSSPLWEGNASVYRNQISVIDYVYSKSGDEPFKYIVYTPPVHDYIYRYLFNWYGEKEYNKLPNEDNAQLLFVIMEPDYENPQRLTDWLKLRENDGEIIDETLVKGGITVQTRKLNVE